MARINIATLPKVQDAFKEINRAIQDAVIPALAADGDKRRAEALRAMPPISDRSSTRAASERFTRYLQSGQLLDAIDATHCVADALQYCYDAFHQYDYYMGRGDEDRALSEANSLAAKSIEFARSAHEKITAKPTGHGTSDTPSGCFGVVAAFALLSAIVLGGISASIIGVLA